METKRKRKAESGKRKFRHTPGPWSIDLDSDGSAAEAARPEVIIETEDRHIAFCFGPGTTNDIQAIADYHLIAVAPEMFDLLQESISPGSEFWSMEQWQEWNDKAHNLLLKIQSASSAKSAVKKS